MRKKRVAKSAGRLRFLPLAVGFLLALAGVLRGSAHAAAQAAVWNLADRFTLQQQGNHLLLQTVDGSPLATFSGALQAACEAGEDGVVLLLLAQQDGVYCSGYTPETGVCSESNVILPACAPDSQMQAGQAADGSLHLRYATAAGGTAQFLVQIYDEVLLCAEEPPEQVSVVWNSDGAVRLDDASPPDASQPDSVPSSEPESASSAASVPAPPPVSSQEPPEEVSSTSSTDSASSQGTSSPQSGAQPDDTVYRCSGPVTVAEMTQELLMLHPEQGAKTDSFLFFTAKGVPIATGSLRTGDVLKEQKDGRLLTVTLLIPGDLCGSGTADAASYRRLRSCIAGGEPLTGIWAMAAKMTQPAGRVDPAAPVELTTADLLLLKRAAGL